MKLHKYIKLARIEMDLTVEALARATGIKVNAIYYIESGKCSIISEKNIKIIFEVLNINICCQKKGSENLTRIEF